ncbi:SBBP repeat-containing protein [Sorangium sp. So ce1000]|uniref:SBBP repeat-containing protein n=1 Tax=Sorangium sp. So ce1000 TaxID=3133325 RepID=UPI003F6374E7
MRSEVRSARAARAVPGLGRRSAAATAAALVAPALPLLAGCPGTIDDQERFDRRDDSPQAACADVPAAFAERCGGASCHGPGEPAAGLDLVTLGVGDRVAGRPATSCAGVLADPDRPEESALYVRLTDGSSCGARMPLGGAPYSSEEIACVAAWIAELTPAACSGRDCGCPGCVCAPGAQEACYTGPEGTLGVGRCAAGTRVCNAEGTSWGPCTGEVLPAFDVCETPDDEDCDGAAPACEDVWSRGFGDANGQYARSAAFDADGNVLVAGQLEGTVDFGGGPLTATGTDAFVAKFDRFGAHLWSKLFPGEGNQFAMALAVDPAGDVVVAGRAFGRVDLGGGELASHGSDDVFVVKLSSGGEHIWSRIFGGSGADRCDRIAVDAAGNVLVAGGYHGAVDFGAGVLTSAGMRDAFVLRLASKDGRTLLAVRAGGEGDDYAQGIAADADGNLLVAGYFEGSIDLGGPPLASAGLSDVFLAKLRPSGDHVWSARFGGAEADEAHDVAVHQATGDVVLTGTFTSTIDLGGEPLVSAGGRDLFVARLSSAGAHLMSRRFGDAEDQLLTDFETGARASVAVDSAGDVLLAGPLFGSADFGGGKLTSRGKTDVYLVKLDASGDHLFSSLFGDVQTQVGLDVAAGSGANVLIAGRFYGGIDFGQGLLSSAGQGDAFVAKLSL